MVLWRGSNSVRTRNLHDSGQAIYPLCYEFSLWFVCAYNIFDVIKCTYYSKNMQLNGK